MINFFRNYILSFFSSDGHERTIKIKKNIIYLFFIKGYSVIISLVLIPLTLNLLNDYKYGVWITVFNLISMIQVFDIGIGNGLRNRFAECMANNDFLKAKQYVSTAYIIMGALSLTIIILFIIPLNYVEWSSVFNTKPSMSLEIKKLIGICFILTALQFFFNLINSILIAFHKPVITNLFFSISNTFIVLIFLLFKPFLIENLLIIGFIYTLTPLIIFLGLNLWLFNKEFKNIKPSFFCYDKTLVKDLFSLGMSFFIVQIAVLVIFQTDALIISHVLSPDEVTPYSIVYKYFSVITMFTTIVLTPFWSAYTESYIKKDFQWIKKSIIIQLKGFIIVIIMVIIMLIFSEQIISIWLNRKITLPPILLYGTAFFVVISVWNNIFAMLLNGLSKIKVQLIAAVLGLVINIPLSIYLAKIYGSGGVIIATCISLFIFAIFGAIESFKIIKTNLNE